MIRFLAPNLRCVRRRSRPAFTLLEMLLTLAMSVVLMILISGAIQFFVDEMETAKGEFEQTQVATAVMQMIENDLRMTLVAQPVDTAALADVLAAASSPLEALGLTDPAAIETSEDDVIAADASLEEDLLMEELDLTVGSMILQSPGLIGDEQQIQVDISRLPSLEETVFDPELSGIGGQITDRPSDIKTVAYFVQPAGIAGARDAIETLSQGADAITGGAGSMTGGLVRRELDRAISNQAASSGGLSLLVGAGDLLAPEVAAINFEYFDGINWLPQYNSDEIGYLPPAIRVTLQLVAPENSDQGETLSEPVTYTHVIALPMSNPQEQTDETLESEETMESDLPG